MMEDKTMGSNNFDMSPKGLELLKEWEGYRKHIYNDAAGLPTIGVGHLLTRDELRSGKILIGDEYVRYSAGLSDQQVLDLLHGDVQKFEDTVNNYVQVPLNQDQFDALVSFAFNVGGGAFRNSTLLKVLNSGNYDGVPDQFMRWSYSGGRQLPGLLSRRRHEISLWNGEL